MSVESRYVVVRRSDIPRGTLQVTDLHPNSSQKNQVYDGASQGPKYLNRFDATAVTTSVGGGGAILAARDLTGIGAYLIDHVEAGGLAAGLAALTFAEANSAAAAIAAIADAGTALTLAAVNAAIAGVVADTELTSVGGSASTGSLEGLLRVMAGGVYTVPAGSVLDTDGSTFNPVVSGSFDDGKDLQLLNTSSFIISNDRGQIAKLKSASFSYLGTAGAVVACYDNTGAVI